MAHFEDAEQLVNHARSALPKLEQEYSASLNEQSVKATLLIDIKNLLENLRSALDFSAVGLFAKYGSSTRANPKIYFPYATLSQTQAAFQTANRIETCIPGISSARSDIVARLESYQHYSSPLNGWLPKFMELNNENKHEKLTPQTRQEARQLRIESGGTSMSIGPGASIRIGSGASIRIGGTLIPGGQNISGDRPAVVHGPATQTVIVWVSFIFDSNGEQVVPFLKTAANGVEKIVRELASI